MNPNKKFDWRYRKISFVAILAIWGFLISGCGQAATPPIVTSPEQQLDSHDQTNGWFFDESRGWCIQDENGLTCFALEGEWYQNCQTPYAGQEWICAEEEYQKTNSDGSSLDISGNAPSGDASGSNAGTTSDDPGSSNSSGPGSSVPNNSTSGDANSSSPGASSNSGDAPFDCNHPDYYQTAIDLNKSLYQWNKSIHTFWLREYPAYSGGKQWFSGYIVVSRTTNCDDYKGYSAQSVMQIDPTTGNWILNEIRIDGPHWVPFYYQWADVMSVVVLAHEYGHSAQTQLGILNVVGAAGKTGELQADCMAGAYIGDWYSSTGWSGKDEFWNQALQFQALSGDDIGADGDTKIPHGTAQERQKAMIDGFQSGIAVCLQRYSP